MSSETVEQDLHRIIEILCRLTKQTKLGPDEDFYNAGVTSIMTLPLLIELEEVFQVTIPDADFLDARTPRLLAETIAKVRADA